MNLCPFEPVSFVLVAGVGWAGLGWPKLQLSADEIVKCLVITDPSESVRMAGVQQAHRAFWGLVKHWKSSENAHLLLKSEDGDLNIVFSVNVGKYCEPAAASQGYQSSWSRTGPGRQASAEQAEPSAAPTSASPAPPTPVFRRQRRSKPPSAVFREERRRQLRIAADLLTDAQEEWAGTPPLIGVLPGPPPPTLSSHALAKQLEPQMREQELGAPAGATPTPLLAPAWLVSTTGGPPPSPDSVTLVQASAPPASARWPPAPARRPPAPARRPPAPARRPPAPARRPPTPATPSTSPPTSTPCTSTPLSYLAPPLDTPDTPHPLMALAAVF